MKYSAITKKGSSINNCKQTSNPLIRGLEVCSLSGSKMRSSEQPFVELVIRPYTTGYRGIYFMQIPKKFKNQEVSCNVNV